MSTQSGKRTANLKLTLNKRAVESLKPADKPFIAWDDKLTGFGLRVQPSGVRSYIVNYRAGAGGRKAANRRLVIGRHGRVPAMPCAAASLPACVWARCSSCAGTGSITTR